MLWVGTLGAAFFAAVLVSDGEMVGAAVAGAFALGFGLIALAYSARLDLDLDGIALHRPFRPPRRVAWDQITQATLAMGALRLDVPHEPKLWVSNQIGGFPEVLEALRARRPDLFGTKDIRHFYRKAAVAVMGILITIAFPALMVAAVGDGLEGWTVWAGALLCLLGPIMLLTEVREVIVEPDALRLIYLFRERLIRRGDVERIALEQEAVKNDQRVTVVAVYHRGGKRQKLGGFREGDLELYGALQRWREPSS